MSNETGVFKTCTQVIANFYETNLNTRELINTAPGWNQPIYPKNNYDKIKLCHI